MNLIPRRFTSNRNVGPAGSAVGNEPMTVRSFRPVPGNQFSPGGVPERPAAPIPMIGDAGATAVNQQQAQEHRSTYPTQPQTAAPRGPNQGGTISTSPSPGVSVTQRFASSAYAGPNAATQPQRPPAPMPARFTPPGSMAPQQMALGKPKPASVVPTPVAPGQRPPGGPAPITAKPAPQQAPVAGSAAPLAPQTQSEEDDPLDGDETTAPGGSTTAVNPGQSLGFSARGSATPAGMDASHADPLVGGAGLYARRFTNPTSAGLYNDFASRIGQSQGFGDAFKNGGFSQRLTGV